MTPHDEINIALDGNGEAIFGLIDKFMPDLVMGKPLTYGLNLSTLVDLIDRAMPGWMWRVQTCGLSSEAWVAPDLNDLRCAELDPQTWDSYYERNEVEIRPGSPRAAEVTLCAAMLRAWVDAGGLK